MSGPSLSGGVTPANFTSHAPGSPAAFAALFGGSFSAFTGSGVATVPGSLVVGASVTVDGASAVNDTSSGGNHLTVLSSAAVFGSANDTISAGAAVTVFGSNVGLTSFDVSGPNSSVVGGSGDIAGLASGANSTLVGGTGNSLFSVSGANSLAVAGPSGITGIDLRGSTAPEVVATNPLGNSGTLVADLGAGASTVIGGSGASTITGGSAPDVYAFVKGHAGGSEVILGFKDSDNIAFDGYGYSAGNSPVETLEDFHGVPSDQLTLTDGTKITLVGIDHKLF